MEWKKIDTVKLFNEIHGLKKTEKSNYRNIYIDGYNEAIEDVLYILEEMEK